MKLLFCCESYWPHRGGVQEVMRQIAERMAAAGHEVGVATRVHPDRKSDVHNGVRIHSFDIGGNLVTGIRGEVDRYRKFLTAFDGDAILIKAAQQWSFDALWPVLDQIEPRKVFVPCGFSSFYEPSFKDYFAQLPDILRKFDHLIFYAERYRDIDFARANGITRFSIIPNGASETEFGREVRRGGGELRQELGIPASDWVFLTVGAPTSAKGHETIAEAFAQVDTAGRGATLILNGNWPPSRFNFRRIRAVLGHLINPDSIQRGILLFRQTGLKGLMGGLFPRPPDRRSRLERAPKSASKVEATAVSPAARPEKMVLRVDLPREKVVDAFFEVDLFVFASKVEYSPLVLFESAAAGTPFLTVPAGNAAEIVRWTGGGWLCPAEVDDRGYIKVSSAVLAREMEKAIRSPDRLRSLGNAGRRSWQERFTWAKIAQSYERVLRGEAVMSPMQSETPDSAVNG